MVEHTHFDKEGSPFYVEVSASPVKNDMGQIIQTIHIARDITERKRMEEEIRKYTKYLEELVEERTRDIREFTFRENKVVPGESYRVQRKRLSHLRCLNNPWCARALLFERKSPKAYPRV